MNVKARLELLRSIMRERNLDAYLVPSQDPHQSEYVAEYWQGRAWLSGFTGSAGTLVVTQEAAGLWTDARYYIRAEQALKGTGIHLFKLGEDKIPNYDFWLAATLRKNARLGLDGSVISVAQHENLKAYLTPKNIEIITEHDLLAEIWLERPRLQTRGIVEHELSFAGESRKQKLERVRAELVTNDSQVLLVTSLDDCAWLFNLRGQDVPFNPVFLAYALIDLDSASLFVSEQSLPLGLVNTLANDGVQVFPYQAIYEQVAKLTGTSVLLDPQKTSFKLATTLSKDCKARQAPSLVSQMKAIKNKTEYEGIKASQIRDAVAFVKWQFWLEEALKTEQHTELSLADKLTVIRAEMKHYQGQSFNPIVAYKANSAVGHYQSDPKTVPSLKPEGILLIDSGAQYLDGTTDITRTLSLGKPSSQEKKVFTTVLKSLIRLSTLSFPKGTTGQQLDAITRVPLWEQGWDCRHGIGHGVGYFLNVHEGPQRFSKTNDIVFEVGMLSSNEPGVYFEGEFGVRLENLLFCVEKETTTVGTFLGFETVTFCPIDLNLVALELLNEVEKDWLNRYHTQVYGYLSSYLQSFEKDFLKEKVRVI